MIYQQFRGALASALTIVVATTALMTQVSTAETDVKPKPVGTTVQPKPVDTTAPLQQKTNTLVDLAASSKQYKTLVAAIKAADLAETLSGEGPFTLFAPNDAAFQKLPKGTLEKLLKPENKSALQQVLKYHVLSGTLMSKDLKTGAVATVEGSKVSFKVVGKKVTINNAQILKANVKASNGVAYAIDRVLIPANLKLK
jgi:uncharacterized surface protein with fasciclin (FAS1) repeats